MCAPGIEAGGGGEGRAGERGHGMARRWQAAGGDDSGLGGDSLLAQLMCG